MNKPEAQKRASIGLVAATAFAFAAASCGGQSKTTGDRGLSNRSDDTELAASTGEPAAGNQDGNDMLVATAASGDASCDAVVGKLIEMISAQMKGSMPAEKKELAARIQRKISEAMLVSCNEDQWPDEVKTCVMEARDKRSMDACGDIGGPEFEEKVRKRMEPVMKELMEEMKAADDAPPADHDQPGPGKDDEQAKD